MIIARPVLMGSPPPRPVTDRWRGRGSRPDEVSEQVLGFGSGQRDERLRAGRLVGVSRSMGGDTEAEEEGRGQQDKGDMAIPAEVTAHFIVIESGVFGGLQVLFDVPAAANGLHDGGQRRSREPEDEVGGYLAGVAGAATQDEELAVSRRRPV